MTPFFVDKVATLADDLERYNEDHDAVRNNLEIRRVIKSRQILYSKLPSVDMEGRVRDMFGRETDEDSLGDYLTGTTYPGIGGFLPAVVSACDTVFKGEYISPFFWRRIILNPVTKEMRMVDLPTIEKVKESVKNSYSPGEFLFLVDLARTLTAFIPDNNEINVFTMLYTTERRYLASNAGTSTLNISGSDLKTRNEEISSEMFIRDLDRMMKISRINGVPSSDFSKMIPSLKKLGNMYFNEDMSQNRTLYCKTIDIRNVNELSTHSSPVVKDWVLRI